MSDTPLRILYAGPLHPGGTCFQRMRALRELGHHVVGVDTYPEKLRRRERRLLHKLRYRVLGPWDAGGGNAKIIDSLGAETFDVLWLDKALVIRRSTLLEARRICPGLRVVGYSPDDMNAPHNQSRRFLDHLPLYDIYFTTKSYGVAELMALGARRAEFVANAFDRNVHRPMIITETDRDRLGGPVGFIGEYEPQRAAMLHHLAADGVPVRIWGPAWHKHLLPHRNLRIEGQPLWGDDYARAICAFDINLCFLRKVNRDLQTTRSVEIPACGAFMLAERTDEHRALFREDQEAAFFEGNEELVRKVRYYLEHDAERRAIAAAGRERCLRDGYSNHDRLNRMIQRVRSL